MYVTQDPARKLEATTGEAVPVKVRAALTSASAASTGYVNRWWRVDGMAAPGSLMTSHLQIWNGSAWESTQSFGPVAADGSLTRWWKPTQPGTFRLRLQLTNAHNEPAETHNVGLPIYREFTVKVTSRQTIPTYLNGFTGPTTDTVVRSGTKMSSYGRLKVRYSNGTIGPLANQQVAVQIQDGAAWRNVAQGPTSATGYFYTNWNVSQTWPHPEVKVRYVYTSPFETIKSTAALGATIPVQPN